MRRALERTLGRPWLLVAVVALGIALPVLVAAEVGASDARERFHRAAAVSTGDAARRAADVIKLRLDFFRSQLDRTNSPSFSVALATGDREAALSALRGSGLSQEAANLWVADARGRAFVSAVFGTDPADRLPNVAAQPFFTRALRLGQLERRAFVTANTHFDQPLFFEGPLVVAPVGAVDVRGLVIAQIRPSDLTTLLRQQLGPVDDLVLFDEDGRLIARAAETGRTFDDLRGSAVVRSSLAGSPVQGDADDPMGGGPRVVGVAPVSGSGWRVAAVVGVTAAERDLAASLDQQRLVRLGLVAALLVGAYLFARVAAQVARQREALDNANRELAEASRQLELASKNKSDFLANMSHELRTPLNAIIGFSDVLDQRMFGELNERQADYVRDIAGSGRHLLALVNEILDLSKVEAGRMELEPSEFALGDTIGRALAFVRERAARHGIELAADLPPDLGTLVADERKVRQVLLNLLSNAVKFTPDGGWIGVSACRLDGEVRVSVRDTGIGIAPEDQAKVFQEFQQVGRPSDRSREGTGLGLTLAKRFVELHGGRIWLESEVGKGTTFTFAMPAAREATAGSPG